MLVEMDENQISKVIDGAKGGLIVIIMLKESQLELVITTGVLVIPQGAFKALKKLQCFTNSETASVQFFPPMKFDKPLILNLLFTGLNNNRFKFFRIITA